jgi:hypothetical protein
MTVNFAVPKQTQLKLVQNLIFCVCGRFAIILQLISLQHVAGNEYPCRWQLVRA